MLITNFIYVQIYLNRITARNVVIGDTSEQRPAEPFSHSRALVGDFLAAQAILKVAVKAVQSKSLLSLSACILMHPMELVEGGLSQVEDRVMQELSVGAGARKVVVWVGAALSNDAVRSKF